MPHQSDARIFSHFFSEVPGPGFWFDQAEVRYKCRYCGLNILCPKGSWPSLQPEYTKECSGPPIVVREGPEIVDHQP